MQTILKYLKKFSFQKQRYTVQNRVPSQIQLPPTTKYPLVLENKIMDEFSKSRAFEDALGKTINMQFEFDRTQKSGFVNVSLSPKCRKFMDAMGRTPDGGRVGILTSLIRVDQTKALHDFKYVCKETVIPFKAIVWLAPDFSALAVENLYRKAEANGVKIFLVIFDPYSSPEKQKLKLFESDLRNTDKAISVRRWQSLSQISRSISWNFSTARRNLDLYQVPRKWGGTASIATNLFDTNSLEYRKMVSEKTLIRGSRDFYTIRPLLGRLKAMVERDIHYNTLKKILFYELGYIACVQDVTGGIANTFYLDDADLERIAEHIRRKYPVRLS